MKKYILISGNLLLLFIFLLPFFLIWITAGSFLDIFHHDKFKMMPVFCRIYLLCIVGAGIIYFFQHLLRKTNKIQKILSGFYVFGTIIFIILVVLDFFLHVPMKAVTVELPLPGLVAYFSLSNNVYQQMFVVWVLLFVIYSCFRLAPAKESIIDQ